LSERLDSILRQTVFHDPRLAAKASEGSGGLERAGLDSTGRQEDNKPG